MSELRLFRTFDDSEMRSYKRIFGCFCKLLYFAESVLQTYSIALSLSTSKQCFPESSKGRKSHLIPTFTVIWYIVSFRQNNTDRPVHDESAPTPSGSPIAGGKRVGVNGSSRDGYAGGGEPTWVAGVSGAIKRVPPRWRKAAGVRPVLFLKRVIKWRTSG